MQALQESNESISTLRQAQLIMLTILIEFDRICRKHNLEYWLEAGTLLGAVRHKGFIPWDDDIDIGMTRSHYDRFVQIAPQEISDSLFVQNIHTDKNYTFNFTKIRDRNSILIDEYHSEKHHAGIFIDIFPFDYFPEKSEKTRRWYNICKKIYKTCRVTTLYRRAIFKQPFWASKNIKKNIRRIIFFPLATLFGFLTIELADNISNKLRNHFLGGSEGQSNYIGYGLGMPWYMIQEYDTVFPLQKMHFENVEFSVPNNAHEYLTVMYGDYMQLPPENKRKQHSLEFKLKLTKEEYRNLNKGYEKYNRK